MYVCTMYMCLCTHTHTHVFTSPCRGPQNGFRRRLLIHPPPTYSICSWERKKDTHKTQDMMSSALHGGDCCMQSTCITGIVYLFLAMYVHDWRISITSILLETCNTQNFITLYEFTRATSTLLKFQLAKPTCMYTVHVLVITS